MTAATDLDKVAADLFIWQAYDPAVKADLSSSAIVTAHGIFVIDPIPLRKAPLAQLHGQAVIAGVIVTNANHLRASSNLLSSSRFRSWRVAPYFLVGRRRSSASSLMVTRFPTN